MDKFNPENLKKDLMGTEKMQKSLLTIDVEAEDGHDRRVVTKAVHAD